jgi:hypothetical protein
MFAFLVFRTLSLGHYSPVDVSDPAVERVKDFVTTRLPRLFPDARGSPEITAAERQMVVGYNLKLTVKFPRYLALVVSLWVNADQQIQLTSLAPIEDDRALTGGWRWQSVDSFTEEERKNLKGMIAEKKEFKGEISTIFAVRTQTVSGRNQHIIFSDDGGQLHSVVVYTNTRQEKSVSRFQTIDQN